MSELNAKQAVVSRRKFLAASVIGVAGSSVALPWVARAEEKSVQSNSHQGRIFTSVKWGMIEGPETVLEKFQICKELGFGGMELVSPAEGFDAEEIRAASMETGMPVHGLVNTNHWKVRLSSPEARKREAGVEILRDAIRNAHAFGGDSVLTVPGKVTGAEATHEHVWRRSIIGIRQVLPLASRLGVRVLIENVWNGFCETPEELRDYLDEIDSPWVGNHFDIGNVRKFSPSEDWIRILGSRIVKLDVKDWGATNGFCKIGDGDVNWPAVREALAEIGFTGWCTAEVAGGDRERLADIAGRIDRVLGL